MDISRRVQNKIYTNSDDYQSLQLHFILIFLIGFTFWINSIGEFFRGKKKGSKLLIFFFVARLDLLWQRRRQCLAFSYVFNLIALVLFTLSCMKQSFCQLVEVVLSFSNDTVMSISRSCKLVIQHYFLRFAPQLCLYNSTSLFASVGELVVGPAYVPLNYKGNC